VTSEVQDQLNDAGVNCLRSFPRRGIRVWGARTLSGQRPWRYVNVRRTFLTLVHRIKHDMNDLTFEPNTPLLWDRVLERLRGFCYELFERGALKGTTPEEGFFLKCDAETNPLEERDAGRVVCEIGLALGAPAEFIVLRMTRTVEGTFTAVPTAV
jgi:Bacteriophage tail sheath protein